MNRRPRWATERLIYAKRTEFGSGTQMRAQGNLSTGASLTNPP
jgi:hypothetical protein